MAANNGTSKVHALDDLLDPDNPKKLPYGELSEMFEVLKELVTQQQRMQNLLEEVHERQDKQAASTAKVVEDVIWQAFARHAKHSKTMDSVFIPSQVAHHPASSDLVPKPLDDIKPPPEPPSNLHVPGQCGDDEANKINEGSEGRSGSKDENGMNGTGIRDKYSKDETGPSQYAQQIRSSASSQGYKSKKDKKKGGSAVNYWHASKVATRTLEDKESWRDEQRKCLRIVKRVVQSNEFDYFVGFVILMNSCFIAIQTDYVAQELKAPTHPMFRACDLTFTLFFSIELAVRIAVERIRFITGRNKQWNFFDSVVVSTAIIEELMSLSSNTRVLRLLRVMRLVRLARFIRVMRVFRELRAMVFGIMHSIMSLIWAIILLLLIMFLFACYLTQAVTDEFMDEGGSQLAEEDREILRQAYGGLMYTMYSLYQAITGGQDWSYFADPLFKISSLLGTLFCFYIAFAVFAVLNVVTGVFVDNAMKSTELDTDLMIVEENATRMRNAEALRAVFHGADFDGSGTLDWEEFKMHLENPAVLAYFRQLGLDLEGPGVVGLWELLDFDRNGTLNIDELVHGAARLKGPALSLDLARESYQITSQQELVIRLLKEVKENNDALKSDVQKVAGRMGIPLSGGSSPKMSDD